MSVAGGGNYMIKIGTRGSQLARWQANWVAARLRELHAELTVELVEIKTLGDRDQNSPLAQIGGLGLFTKEIQRALLDGSIDLAVHSLKDLPTQQPEELILAAVPAREDLADAFVAPRCRTLEALPRGARIGTGSPRRRAQLLCLRPDLDVVSLRGNIDTRLNYALRGELDGVVLACAGLCRLGLDHHITQRLEPPNFLPAVGQGALGLECRRNDAVVMRLVENLSHEATYRAVMAERAVLYSLQGGCTLPLAAWGRDVYGPESQSEDRLLAIDAAVFTLDGSQRIAVSLQGPQRDPEALGRQAALALIERGASSLLGHIGSPAQ
jgi:hydroxymethylbilane synthase